MYICMCMYLSQDRQKVTWPSQFFNTGIHELHMTCLGKLSHWLVQKKLFCRDKAWSSTLWLLYLQFNVHCAHGQSYMHYRLVLIDQRDCRSIKLARSQSFWEICIFLSKLFHTWSTFVMLVVLVRVALGPRKLTRASEQLWEVGRRLMACYLSRTEVVGLSDG